MILKFHQYRKILHRFRWRNFITRGMSGTCLLTGFSIIVWMGPIGLIFLVSWCFFSILYQCQLYTRYEMTTIRVDQFRMYLLSWCCIRFVCICIRHRAAGSRFRFPNSKCKEVIHPVSQKCQKSEKWCSC